MTQTSDRHINTAESATRNGTGSPLIAAGDVASTEDKTPGCTIGFVAKTHPFEQGHTLVFVRGQWANGTYAPFPSTSDGMPFAKSPDKATNAPGGLLRQVRFGGGYAVHSGHYASGYVFDLRDAYLDDCLAWLAQAKDAFESRIPQVNAPPKPGKKAKVENSTAF